MSKDFDATLSEAIDLAAEAAHTKGGATAARIRGRQRTMRKRITVSATTVILLAAGSTAAAVQLIPNSHGTPQTGQITITKTSARPTSPVSTAPTTPPAPSAGTSTATAPGGASTTPNPSTASSSGTSTGTATGAGTNTAAAPGSTTSAGNTSAPFPGIWDITSWQQYGEMQAAVEQGHQPWLLDPESVVQAWAAAQQLSSPTVVRLDTDTFRVTTSTGVLYTVDVTCPGAGSAAPIWVITHIS